MTEKQRDAEDKAVRDLRGKQVRVLGMRATVRAVRTAPMVYVVPEDDNGLPQWVPASQVMLLDDAPAPQ